MANEGCIIWSPKNPEEVTWTTVSPAAVVWTAMSAYAATWILKLICAGTVPGMSEQYHLSGLKLNVYRFAKILSEQTHLSGNTLIVNHYGGLSEQTCFEVNKKIYIYRVT